MTTLGLLSIMDTNWPVNGKLTEAGSAESRPFRDSAALYSTIPLPPAGGASKSSPVLEVPAFRGGDATRARVESRPAMPAAGA